MDTHASYMRRALELARLGLGRTSPNPPVGAVIVRDGEIIGEGYHRAAGIAHAEVDAIQNASQSVDSSTIYVTLEPCNHHGRTPPCTSAILDAGIASVVYGVTDPNPRVEGRGADWLRAAGLDVVEGILEDECREVARFFLHSATTNSPWVIAKFASTLDGKIATTTGQSQWITGDASRRRSHQLRGLVDAVVVGAGTVRADRPTLTARIPGVSQPLRVVVAGSSELPPDAPVFDPKFGPTLVFAGSQIEGVSQQIGIRGTDVVQVDTDASGRLNLGDVLEHLSQRGIQSVMVEGGGELLGSFVTEGHVDEVWAFLSMSLVGGRTAATSVGGTGLKSLADRLQLAEPTVEILDQDLLVRAFRKDHPTLAPARDRRPSKAKLGMA